MNDRADLVKKLFEGFKPLLVRGDADVEGIKEVCRAQADYLPNNPINIVAIANQFDLRVYAAKLKGDISGVLDLSEKRIYLERSDSVERKRFTCAHEVGHFLLHRNRQEMFLFRGDYNSEIEKEANKMAAEILMPAHFVKEFLRTMTFPDMAKKFAVSDTDAKYRAESICSGS